MLDIRLLREELNKVQQALNTRGTPIAFDAWIVSDKTERTLKGKIEQLQAQKNKASNEIVALKNRNAPVDSLLIEMKQVAQEIEVLKADLKKVQEENRTFLLTLPNIPDPSVPMGRDAADNQEVRQWGKPPSFAFTPKPHWEIGESLGILDFERAAKMTGARYALYLGLGARLERALINYMLDLHGPRYKEVFPPLMVNRESLTMTGQLPKFEEDLFQIEGEDTFLIPTGEVHLTNIHRGDILQEDRLPLFYMAYTPCFRREAGSYGKDTRGLIRQHQFNKVELVIFATAEQSQGVFEQLVLDAEEVLKRLGLHYRVMALCTGDIGFASAKTYDIEVWLPGQAAYREISSCSYFEAFQARRAKIRYQTSSGKLQYVHTLNGSGLAVGRTVAALLENGQQEDGSVLLPEALWPYMGGIKKIEKE